MKIAILSEKFITGGGVERYLQDLVGVFLAESHEVVFYTTKVNLKPNFLNREGLHVVCQDLSLCPRKLRHIFFDRFLRQRLSAARYDMVLGVTTPYSPHVSVCCGTYLKDMLTFKPRLLNPLNWVRVFYEKKKYSGAKITVIHSKMQEQELISLFGISADRIRVLPPPTSSSFRIKNEKSRLRYRKKYCLDDKKWNLLFVSTGHRRKGLATIIRMLEILQHDNCRVVVAGSPRGRFPDSGHIRYLGYIERIDELYHACDATLLPSVYEPFGLVVPESLLSGTPVFISDRVGAADVMQDGMGWVVPAGDAAALAAAVESFLNEAPAFPVHEIAQLRDRLSVASHAGALLRLAEETAPALHHKK